MMWISCSRSGGIRYCLFSWILKEALLSPYRSDCNHRASMCGRWVDVLIKTESDIPDCHWHHAVAIRRILDIMVSVLQCLTNNESCPSLWSTHQGIIPHPASDFGAYLKAKAVCRLKPILARMIDAVLDSAFARCL